MRPAALAGSQLPSVSISSVTGAGFRAGGCPEPGRSVSVEGGDALLTCFRPRDLGWVPLAVSLSLPYSPVSPPSLRPLPDSQTGSPVPFAGVHSVAGATGAVGTGRAHSEPCPLCVQLRPVALSLSTRLSPLPALSALGDQLSGGVLVGRHQAFGLGWCPFLLPHVLVAASGRPDPCRWLQHLTAESRVCGPWRVAPPSPSPLTRPLGAESVHWPGFCHPLQTSTSAGGSSCTPWFLTSPDMFWRQAEAMDVDAEREKITQEIKELERILDPSSSSINMEVSESSLDSDSDAGELPGRRGLLQVVEQPPCSQCLWAT